jgi:hypothetical protein
VNAFTSSASLIIQPDNPDWFPDDPEEAPVFLKNTGLIADSIPGKEQSYYTGDNFLELVSFMGCSPSINLIPQKDDDKFSFIKLVSSQEIIALTSRHTHSPHCPHCKKAEKNWLTIMTGTALQCSSCGLTSAPWHYNWRQSAGFGRFFIELTEIYPKEAIPQPSLLSALEKHHGISWSYFYLAP